MTQTNSFKLTLPLLALNLLSLISGCTIGVGGLPDTDSSSPRDRASGGSSSGGSSSGGSASGGAPAAEGPVTVPFDQLVVQTVQWFDKDVTIEKADTKRSPRSTTVTHSVQFTIQNRTRFASRIRNDHWDLFLSDGTRLDGDTDAASFGPHDAVSQIFQFEDKLDRSLEGAYMELNGSTYGEYKTLILPLDQPMQKEPVLILSDLEGKVAEGEPSATKVWRHEIVSARVSLNSDAHDDFEYGARAKVGKKLVDLVVRTTARDAARNLYGEVYHLMVDGIGASTETHVNDYLKIGDTIEVPLVFQIDENATEFDVELDTDQSPSDETWSIFHVDLANATPVE